MSKLGILLQTVRNNSPWSLEIPTANIVSGALDAAPTTTTPVISTGTAAPTTTPAKAGDMFVDTTTPAIYIATGTTDSDDWTALS